MEEKSSSPQNVRKDAYVTITGLRGYFQTQCVSSRTQTPQWAQVSFVLRSKSTFYETQLLEGTQCRLTTYNSPVFSGSSLRYIPKANQAHHCSAGGKPSNFFVMLDRLGLHRELLKNRVQEGRTPSSCSLQPWYYLSWSLFLRADVSLLQSLLSSCHLLKAQMTKGPWTLQYVMASRSAEHSSCVALWDSFFQRQ